MIFAPFRAIRRATTTERGIKRILVIEPWNIGDVVLAAPFLAALRKEFPEAQISLLARPYAREILRHSGLVDEVIDADLPWTAPRNKYRFDSAARAHMRQLIATLRERHFGLTIDARMDIRSNLLAAVTAAPHRIGYDIGGGGWLLTESLPSDRDETHKRTDWEDLLQLLPRKRRRVDASPFRPLLVVTRDEKEEAERLLTQTLGAGSPTVAYHPGGSHLGKRWPAPRFRELIEKTQQAIGGRHIVLLGPTDEDPGDWPSGAAMVRPGLRELMALLSCTDVFVCNDSGPMHIADALDVPLVAIFEVGNPKWFGPSGPRAKVVAGEKAGTGLSAAPLDEPPANPVSVDRVFDAVMAVLSPAVNSVATP